MQLPLNVQLRDDATLANYYSGENREVVECLDALDRSDREKPIYLWGAPAVGKSHLLQAVCQKTGVGGSSVAYLPLAELKSFSPSMLDGLERLDLVCIDDIHSVAGDSGWEAELFHLLNRCRDNAARVIASGDASPGRLALHLSDLKSRLSWGLVFHLRPLSDEQKMSALQLRARQRGLELPLEVARFLLRHHHRDMAELFSLLERLDHASLAAQRRLTIPFVRQWL